MCGGSQPAQSATGIEMGYKSQSKVSSRVERKGLVLGVFWMDGLAPWCIGNGQEKPDHTW